MIRILAREHSTAVALVSEKLNIEAVPYDVYITKSEKAMVDCLANSTGMTSLIMIGDIAKWCTTFAETFSLSLVYDKRVEAKIKEYCKLSGLPIPAQYMMDKYCMLPETFIHYTSVFGMQCACGGEMDKSRIYILPDDAKECDSVWENYIAKDLFKMRTPAPAHCFKLFGLSRRDLDEKIAKVFPKVVSVSVETDNLDSKVTVMFPRNCAKKVVSDTLENFQKEFDGYIYADSDKSLAQTVVVLLNERYKTVATAESITGGLIASSIVDVPGASNVLYEGAVTYTIDSKCKRLGISPHYIDEYGVVSAQVAKDMAASQLVNADYSVSTTGYAGPTSDDKHPVGLCYVGIGAKVGGKTLVKVFKNIFRGDRNTIRAQVANTAMFLLIQAMQNSQFYSTKK